MHRDPLDDSLSLCLSVTGMNCPSLVQATVAPRLFSPPRQGKHMELPGKTKCDVGGAISVEGITWVISICPLHCMDKFVVRVYTNKIQH